MILNPLFYHFDLDRDEEEMFEIQLQMKHMNAEEAQLDRYKRQEWMKKGQDEQKQRVRDMKGKYPIPTKTSDL